MKKLWTTLYHPQINGLVEISHQTIMQMIRKLREDKKAKWPGHLAEIVQAYNATQYAMMEYSPHYLMFGCWPWLLVNFYFPTFRSADVPMRGASARCVDEYMATVQDWLKGTLLEAQAQSMAEAQWQKQYYGWKIGAMNLKPGDLVLVKADIFNRKRKMKDRWEDETCGVVQSYHDRCPLLWRIDQCRQSCILHWNWLLLIASETGVPLCVGIHHVQDQWTIPTPLSQLPNREWQ